MTTRRFTNICVLSTSIIAVLFFALAAHSATSSPATVSRSEVADLAQTIEELNDQVKLLQKKIQMLSDLLWDITNAVNASKPAEIVAPLTAAQATPGSTKAKLRSPRQIDRAPVREEKTRLLLTKLQVSELEETMVAPLTKLLTTKNQSNFVQSLRTQLTQWLETPLEDRSFNSPFSAKQFAWVQFLMYPGEYENPKKNKDLYPNG